MFPSSAEEADFSHGGIGGGMAGAAANMEYGILSTPIRLLPSRGCCQGVLNESITDAKETGSS